MPRSDSAPPASDAQMREVARQLADAAPPAPSWHELGIAIHGRAARRPTSVPKLALAFAAVVAVLVAGLWWGARSLDDEELPADLPAPSTLPRLSAADQWASYVTVTDPLDVQLCLARATSNRTAEADLPAPAVRDDLAMLTDSAAVLAWHWGAQVFLAVLADAPGLDADAARGLGDVVAAYEAADAARSTPSGLEATGPLVDEFLRRRDESTALDPDPDRCWVESSAGTAALEELRRAPDGDLGVLRCLTLMQVDHALASIDGGGIVFERLAEVGAVVVPDRWYDSRSAASDALSAAISDAALDLRLEDPETVAGLRRQLADAIGEVPCPPVAAARPEATIDPIDQGATTP